MRKFYLLGFVAVLVVLLGSTNLAPSVAQGAAALSPGCQALNDPFFDSHPYGSGVVAGYEFWAGEGIVMRATNDPSATTITLTVHSQTVSTSPFPGAVGYTFPENVASETVRWSVDAGLADWAVSCSAPGCDAYVNMTPNAAVGRFTADAPTYWAPGELIDPPVTISAGKTAWVLGMDASGSYYQIIWACDKLWVPANAIAPNVGDPVWSGVPLPTDVVQ